jgi:hypothetical protein
MSIFFSDDIVEDDCLQPTIPRGFALSILLKSLQYISDDVIEDDCVQLGIPRGFDLSIY